MIPVNRTKAVIALSGMLLACAFAHGASPQDTVVAVVSGRITDEESGAPLESVIAFLANTPIGTSTGRDGRFRIRNIPLGAYDLVLSRVGYERQVVPLAMTKPESLFYQIRLKPRPVETPGVDVLGERSRLGLRAGDLFFPKESRGGYCLYGTAVSMPVGVLFTDSAFYMYNLDTAIVDSEKYMRLWLLYKNQSQSPCEFDPAKCVKMSFSGKPRSYRDISPVGTPDILAHIGDQVLQERIRGGVIRSLSADAALQQRVFTLWKKHGWPPGDERGPLAPISVAGVARSCVDDGILKRHVVYPDNCVNGFVFFPFPGLDWKAGMRGFPEALLYAYTLEIVTTSGTRLIEFSAR